MPVIINGTSGITDVDGTAAAPALTGTDTDTGIFFPAANTMAFSTAGTEDMRIDSAGNVGIGTTSPGAKLNVVDSSSNDALRITQTGAGNALVVEDSTNPDSTPFVVDANGGVIVGNSTVIGLNYTSVPRFQVAGTSQATTALSSVYAGSSTNLSGSLLFGKSTGTLASPTAVISGDDLGRIQFEGHDGTAFIPSAQILAEVDGTPGTNDMPGRLSFSTTADGASSPTERMRIDSSGNTLIGGTAARGTTVGTAHLDLFNGTAPAGTLTNGISLYSSSGDFNFMDSAGNGYKVGFRNLPPVGTKTGSYTLAVGDVGKYVQVSTGGSITIPTSTFAEGDAISIANNTTGNITITCSAPTAYIAGTNTVKTSMTLATRGVATVLFISSTVCFVSGNVT